MLENAEEKFNNDVLKILKEFRAELVVTKTENEITYGFIKENDFPTQREQERVIRWLSEIGAISKEEIYNDSILPFSNFNFGRFKVHGPLIAYTIKIDRPIFDSLIKIFAEGIGKQSSRDLLERAKALGKSKILEIEPKPQEKARPFINEERHCVIYLENESKIEPGNQWELCRALFNKPLGSWTKSVDVIRNFNTDNKQSFYDAQRLLNKRFNKDLGIKNLIEYQESMARINPKTIENLS